MSRRDKCSRSAAAAAHYMAGARSIATESSTARAKHSRKQVLHDSVPEGDDPDRYRRLMVVYGTNTIATPAETFRVHGYDPAENPDMAYQCRWIYIGLIIADDVYQQLLEMPQHHTLRQLDKRDYRHVVDIMHRYFVYALHDSGMSLKSTQLLEDMEELQGTIFGAWRTTRYALRNSAHRLIPDHDRADLYADVVLLQAELRTVKAMAESQCLGVDPPIHETITALGLWARRLSGRPKIDEETETLLALTARSFVRTFLTSQGFRDPKNQ